MPSINDRIGSQNVIRVLSNASAPPSRLINLTDVNSSRKTEDGMILVWDLTTERFFMTDAIDASKLTVTGLVTFTNSTDSSSPTTGALAVSGGLGVGKYVNFGSGLTVSGLTTFSSNVDLNASLDVLNNAKINGTFQTVGITTLASSGGITTTGGDFSVGGSFKAKNIVVSGIATFGTIDDHEHGHDHNVIIDGNNELINVGTGLTLSSTQGVITPSINVGGHSELDTVNVSGVSTFVGVSTFISDVYIGGDLYIADDLKFDEVNARNANISGISTVGTLLDVNGNLDVDGRTELDITNISETLNVAGVSTFVGLSTFQNNVFVSGTLEAGLIDGGEY